MLKEFQLVNVCQHHDRTVRLGAGLTVVVGPQGSGKTNLFQMALASLTGDNPIPGNKAANLRYGIGKEPSFVRACWQFGSDDLTVIRGFAKTKSSLSINGTVDPAIRREKEITDKVLQVAGLERDLVMGYSYVKQSETSAVFDITETERVRFFARLLGFLESLDWADRLQEARNVVRSRLSVDHKSRLSQQIVERNRLAVQRLELLQSIRQHESQQAELQLRLSEIPDQSELVQSIDNLESELSSLQENLGRLQKSQESMLGELTRQRGIVERLSVEQTVQDTYAEDLAWNQQRARAEKSLADLQRRAPVLQAGLIAPESPASVEPTEEQVSGLQIAKERAARDLNLRLSGKRVCDACGSQIQVADQDPGQLRQAAQLAVQAANRANQDRIDWLSYRAKLESYNQQLPRIQEELAQNLASRQELEKQLAERPAVQVPAGLIPDGPTGRQTRQTQISAANQQIGSLGEKLETCRQSINRIEQAVPDKEQELANLRASLSTDLEDSRAAILSDLQRLRYDDQLSNQRYSHLGGLVEANRQQIRETLESYRAQLGISDAAELIDSVLPITKPTGLPQKVLYELLRNIGAGMTDLCLELGQDFRVEISDTLEFMVRKSNGYQELAQRLSQGQRACLAVVFWISRLLSGSRAGLPILVLDEPSANMDDTVVSQLAGMLTRLNPILIQRNLQVVLITHHRQLAGSGQYVVNLE